MQRFEASVVFGCPLCGETANSSVEVPEPDWGAPERGPDLNSGGETELSCNRCKAEFPAYLINLAGSFEVRLNDYAEVNVVCGLPYFSPDEADWLELEATGDPYAFFKESYRQAADVLAEHGQDFGAHLVNRMVFTQQVSALEAYLGDTITRAVETDPEALHRLIQTDKELLAEKVSLAEIAKNPNLLGDRVRGHLRGVLYHNLQKVDFLYKTAFDISVLGPKEDNAPLLEAIRYRHDCVHRNGMDANGQRLMVFTRQYVQQTADRMKALVDRIEGELHPPKPEEPHPLPSWMTDLDDDVGF